MSGRRAGLLELGLVLLLVSLFVWKGLVPAWRELNTDFPNYYLTARLYRGGSSLDRVYEWIWFQRQKDHAGIDRGVVGYVPLSPYSALLVAPLAMLPPLVAKRCWLCANLVLLGATIPLLRSMTRLTHLRVTLLLFLSIVPLRANFLFGQQYLVLLFLVALAASFYLRGRDFACGAVLAVAAALKIYPVLFAAFFLLKGRWRALVGLSVVVASLIAAAIPLFGAETLRVYLAQILPRALLGEGNDPYHLGFNSTATLLRRMLVAEPDLNPHPIVQAPAVFAALQPSIQALLVASTAWAIAPGMHRDRARAPLEWGAFVALLLAMSTSSSSYHFCVLILSTVLGVDFLLSADRVGTAFLLSGLHTFLSLPLHWPPAGELAGYGCLLGVPRLYALFGYWGTFLWTLTRASPAPVRGRWEAPSFAAALAGLALVGFASTRRHVDRQRVPGAARLPVEGATRFANAPTVAEQGVYFSEMEAYDRYTLGFAGSGSAPQLGPGVDWFHPTVSSAGASLWVERSSRRSNVYRVRLDTPFDLGRSSPAAKDAEKPAISADGRWLAFLREDEAGRASLWVEDVAASPSSAVVGGEARRVVGSDYDVLDEAFFPDGRIVFAARPQGKASLFVAHPASGAIVGLFSGNARVRYPAVSPDARWLAFSEDEGGAWQLRLLDLATGDRLTLSHADCNATTPCWTLDSKSIVYASDCWRNLGNTTLWRIDVPYFTR